MVIDMTGVWTSAKTVQEKRIEVNRPGYDGSVAQVMRRSRKKVEAQEETPTAEVTEVVEATESAKAE